MRRIPTVVVGAGLGLVALGCGGRSDPTVQAEPLGALARNDLTVEVQNENFYRATVYAYRPGARIRLGVVETSGTETFTFTWPVPGDVRFLVQYLSVGCQLTDPLAVGRGDELLLILEPQDFRSASRRLCDAARG